MRRKEEIKTLCRELENAPLLKTKRVIAIDLIALLEHINNCPPDNIARLNSIILNQHQYFLDVIEE